MAPSGREPGASWPRSPDNLTGSLPSRYGFGDGLFDFGDGIFSHNAVVERFQGTMLHECWRPAFRRRRFTSIRQLQAEADAWLVTYNTRRRNHSDYMNGATPTEILDTRLATMAA